METKSETKNADAGRQLLRHTIATVAYRAAKAFRGAPEGFPTFRINESSRTPGQILAHLGDLFDWALVLAQGRHEWHDSPPLSWEAGGQRFFSALRAFDDYLASDRRLGAPAEELFQGPVADALNHVGQIAMLRRMAGSPIRAENYFKAEIRAGRVGPEQTPPKAEFG
ncbi:MAG: hypothetical protein ACRD52_00270 [Candidatus Acidiferrales bacterium]